MRVHTASLSRHRSHALVLAALHLTLLVGITDPLAAASPPTPSPAFEGPAEALLPLDPPAAEPAAVLLDPALTPTDEYQTFASGAAHLAPDRVLASVIREAIRLDARRAPSSTMLHAARAGEIALSLVPPERYGDHAPADAAARPRHHREILDFDGWTHAGPHERRPGR